MKASDLQIIQETIQTSIKATVNGKIDRLTEKLDYHIDQHEKDMVDLRPIIEARLGGNFLIKILLLAGSLAAAWLAVKSLLL